MLGVGDAFPEFSLKAVLNNHRDEQFSTINLKDFDGKWKVVFFWPKDFTFVCPTEIAGFAALEEEFAKRNATLLGGSIDSEFVHLAWRESDKLLENVAFPMFSDIKRELSSELGILDQQEGVSQRATYVVDAENKIRFVSVTDLAVGRNPDEVLRVLDALQTNKLTPCAWQPGEDTL